MKVKDMRKVIDSISSSFGEDVEIAIRDDESFKDITRVSFVEAKDNEGDESFSGLVISIQKKPNILPNSTVLREGDDEFMKNHT